MDTSVWETCLSDLKDLHRNFGAVIKQILQPVVEVVDYIAAFHSKLLLFILEVIVIINRIFTVLIPVLGTLLNL